MRRVSYSLPPQPVAPTADNTATQQSAEAAAQKEKEELKKRRRPTLLTGYGGAGGQANLMQGALVGGNTKLGQ